MRLISVLAVMTCTMLLAAPAMAQTSSDQPGGVPSPSPGGPPIQARWITPSWQPESDLDGSLIGVLLASREELGLSTAAAASLERLRTDFLRETIRKGAEIDVAELDLATLLEPDPADPARPTDLAGVEAKIREIERLDADLQMAGLRAIETAKALLSREQRSRLTALLAAPDRTDLTDPPDAARGGGHGAPGGPGHPPGASPGRPPGSSSGGPPGASPDHPRPGATGHPHGRPPGPVFHGHPGSYSRGWAAVPWIWWDYPDYVYVPPVYVPTPAYWYYCPAYATYYPYVSSCPEPWVLVPAR